MSDATFVPSPRQRRFREFIDANPDHPHIRDLCQAAQLPRATFYRWCKDPGFRQWFAFSWSSRFLMDGVFLVEAARNRPDMPFRLWKALFDLTFDPKGLGMLPHWQQALAMLSPEGYGLEKSVPSSTEQNQSLSPQTRSTTTEISLPTPAQHLRLLRKVVGAAKAAAA